MSSVTAGGQGPGDRIRAARATGLRDLPLHHTAQNRVWPEIVQIALDLLAWMPMLALTGKARLWEPRRLRLRLFTAAGQLVTTGRRRILRLARHWPWASHITAALERLALLPKPADQRIRLFLREESSSRRRGTRHPPETTLGPSACPLSAHGTKAVHRLRRRTVTQDRG
ncbi:hypothetical protein GCM10010095_81710 [Streptomyces anthocyanicus]|nr:hypothetical protein GCM10010095_81710 [Streptomyces anthocyanicus]